MKYCNSKFRFAADEMKIFYTIGAYHVRDRDFRKSLDRRTEKSLDYAFDNPFSVAFRVGTELS